MLSNIDVKNITEEHKTALMEGFYHANFALEPSELLKWLITTSELFDNAALWSISFPLYEEMLEIQETKLPSEHIDIAVTLHKIAASYYRKGKYKDALLFYLRSLEIRERCLGHEHPDVANVLSSMVWNYFQMGEYNKALSLGNRSLKILKALGTEPLSIAKASNAVAVIHKKRS
ncbi:tetratricopeptide repeat protein [Methanosarcina siciliae]|uniref:tetratricopeptide repeat protein n=1 Tax=Methanosarcina siciliae TaxID=38027 RepID=UPI00064F87E6|nr:tetratricopeptide repeat protein [Methanosarcina siciliae]